MQTTETAAPLVRANGAAASIDADAPTAFLKAADVRRLFRITDVTIHRWVRSGILPAPYRATARGMRLWPRDEVMAAVRRFESANRT
jgi:hypothetical protein